MNIFNLIHRNKRLKQSHLKNLIEVALLDGQLDNNEYVLLLSLARRLKISDQEIKNIQENPGKIIFMPPGSHKKRFEQVYDLVFMMMVDGVIHQKELDFCKKMALKLDYMPQLVDDLIVSIRDSVQKGIPKELSFRELSGILKMH